MSWVAVGVGVVGAGAGIAGAASAPGPANYDPERDSRHNLAAMFMGAPTQFGLENLYGPQYGYLALREQQNYLYGAPQATITRRIPYYDRDGHRRFRTTTVNRPETTGLLGQMEQATPRIGQQYYGDQIQQREGLMNSLAAAAQEDMDLGYEMSPGLRRELEQSTIGSASLRGFGRSPLDAYETYRALGSEAERLRRTRQQFATGVEQLLRQAKPEAVTTAQILGSAGASAQAAAHGPRMYDPFRMFTQPSGGGNPAMSNALMGIGGGLLGAAGQLGGAQMANRNPGTSSAYPMQSYYNPPPTYPIG